MTSATLRHLPSTIVALLAALALAVAAMLLTGLGVAGNDSAGATWNKSKHEAGATWNKSKHEAGATWNKVAGEHRKGATWN